MTERVRESWTLDPKNDYVFTQLFGAAKNRRLLIAFLSDVLRPHVPIVSVEVLPPRPEPVGEEGKLVVLDLRVRLADGQQVDVEMQTRRHSALRERILLYWGRLYSSQLGQGQPYTTLKRCAVILITDFRELRSSGLHSIFQVRERDSGELFTDQLELHLLELPKLRALAGDGDEPALAAWCRFLSAETDDQLEALAMRYPILQEAKTALDELSANEEARFWAQRRSDELYFHEHGLHVSREEGREQGREEGREQGREEGREQGALVHARSTLTRLLKLKFGALPVEVQTRVDAASQPELDAWLEGVLSADSVEAIFR